MSPTSATGNPLCHWKRRGGSVGMTTIATDVFSNDMAVVVVVVAITFIGIVVAGAIGRYACGWKHALRGHSQKLCRQRRQRFRRRHLRFSGISLISVECRVVLRLLCCSTSSFGRRMRRRILLIDFARNFFGSRRQTLGISWEHLCPATPSCEEGTVAYYAFLPSLSCFSRRFSCRCCRRHLLASNRCPFLIQKKTKKTKSHRPPRSPRGFLGWVCYIRFRLNAAWVFAIVLPPIAIESDPSTVGSTTKEKCICIAKDCISNSISNEKSYQPIDSFQEYHCKSLVVQRQTLCFSRVVRVW